MSNDTKKQKTPTLIYQLGTNNWQREGEFAPGSGILHEGLHNGYNSMGDEVKCYSIYPSQIQTPHPDPMIEVFKLDHPIPICESASPVSMYRWHSMSEAEFSAYRERLEEAVYKQMEEAEKKEGCTFKLAIAHHTFLNPLVLRNVLRRRRKEGKGDTSLIAFVHGTALKMYIHEKNKDEGFPLRFLPLLEKEKVFSDDDPDSVKLVYAVSNQAIDACKGVFPSLRDDQVVISPCGINQKIFHPQEGCTIANTLSEFSSWHYEGSPRKSEKIDASKYKRVVIMVGKFAQWKRAEAFLTAASLYEKDWQDTCTLLVGTGPTEAAKELQDFAFDKLGLKNTFFLGPQGQPVLAKLFTISSVGVFPSYKEPFGMVFVECMACGTPVIGCNSGGPKDFVDETVGRLVPEPSETYNIEELGKSLYGAIKAAVDEDWKSSRAQAGIDLVDKRYSVKKQCADLLASTRKHLAI